MKSKRSVVLKEDVKEFIEETAAKEGREFSAQLNVLVLEAKAERRLSGKPRQVSEAAN